MGLFTSSGRVCLRDFRKRSGVDSSNVPELHGVAELPSRCSSSKVQGSAGDAGQRQVLPRIIAHKRPHDAVVKRRYIGATFQKPQTSVPRECFQEFKYPDMNKTEHK